MVGYFKQVTAKFLAFFIGKATNYTFWFVRMEYDLRWIKKQEEYMLVEPYL